MTIDEKLMGNEQFRKECWDKINSNKQFEKEFLILEMRRTITPEIYLEMRKVFEVDPIVNYKWYFNKSLNLGKDPGKSPYECCLDNDYARLMNLLGAIEYGNYL